MRGKYYSSTLWFVLFPIFIVAKLAVDFYYKSAATSSEKPFPLELLDTNSQWQFAGGIFLICLATFLTFTYIKAYIRIQDNYAVALFYGLSCMTMFHPEATTTYIGITFFFIAISRLFSINEKQQSRFIFFDTGLFLGLAFLSEVYIFPLVVLLTVFLLFKGISFKNLLQYCGGILLILLFAFPILYFNNLHIQWFDYYTKTDIKNLFPPLQIADYLLIATLLFILIFKGINLYTKRKPKEQSLLFFTALYFYVSLFIGLYYFPHNGTYILFVIPAISILYSFSRSDKYYSLLSIFIGILGYSIWNFIN